MTSFVRRLWLVTLLQAKDIISHSLLFAFDRTYRFVKIKFSINYLYEPESAIQSPNYPMIPFDLAFKSIKIQGSEDSQVNFPLCFSG